jgi:hypothetical protein
MRLKIQILPLIHYASAFYARRIGFILRLPAIMMPLAENCARLLSHC